MSNKWCRLYAEMPDDPKVGMLDDACFRAWTSCLCFATRQMAGRIGTIEEINWMARRDFSPQMQILLERELVTKKGNIFYVTNWRFRQFQGDISTDRVREHRLKKKSEKSNDGETFQAVSVTVSETPQNRTDTEQIPPNPQMGNFEEFKKLFPKQRAGSWTKAYLAYQRALQRTSHDAIMRGLRSYAGSDEVKRGFAKGAAAWLNDDRWTSQYGGTALVDTDEITRAISCEEYERIKRLAKDDPTRKSFKAVIEAYERQNPTGPPEQLNLH